FLKTNVQNFARRDSGLLVGDPAQFWRWTPMIGIGLYKDCHGLYAHGAGEMHGPAITGDKQLACGNHGGKISQRGFGNHRYPGIHALPEKAHQLALFGTKKNHHPCAALVKSFDKFHELFASPSLPPKDPAADKNTDHWFGARSN